VSGRRLLVIAGCYRSGTTLLARAAGVSEAGREPWPPFAGVRWGDPDTVLLNPHHFDAPRWLPFSARRLSTDYGPWAQRRLLWIVRDPYDVVVSLRESLSLGPDVWPRPAGADWVERGAWLWATMNGAICSRFDELADDVRAELAGWIVDVVRYESLVADLRRLGYERIAQRVDVEWSDTRGLNEAAGADYWSVRSASPTGGPHVGRWRAEPLDVRARLTAVLAGYRRPIEAAGYTVAPVESDRR
jgi:hypothetical protein